MTRSSTVLSLLVAWFVGVALPTTSAAEEYDLNIQYVGAVGETYDFTASSSSSEESLTYIDGELFDESLVESSVALEGLVEYLDVDEDGVVVQLAYRLDAAEVKVEGEPIEVDRSRRLVLDLTDEMPALTYEGGGAVEADLRVLLLGALSQNQGLTGEVEEDDVLLQAMGLDTPREPGTHWGLDYDAFFAATGGDEAFPFVFDPELTEGDVHFQQVSDAEYGEAVAFLTFEVDSTGYAFVEGQLPDVFEATESLLQVDMEVHLPLDSNSSVGRQSFGMTMNFAAEGDMVEQGQKIHLGIDVEVIMHQSMTLTRPE